MQAQRGPEIKIHMRDGEADRSQPWGWRERQLRGGKVDLSGHMELNEQKG